MSRRAMTILMSIVMLATFAFAAPIQQSDKQSRFTKQDKSLARTMKRDKLDQSPQSGSMQNTASTSTLDTGDRKFVIEAAHGGMMEVTLGRMAVDKATNPDVKQFAQRMIDDHSKANTELQQLASQKGITLPASDLALTDQSSTMSNSTARSTDSQSSSDTTSQHHAHVDTSSGTMKDQSEMNKLAGLSGDAFDREYVKLMVKDHEKDVKEFEKQSTKAKDPDLRAWVTKTLPTLREHLQQINDIQRHMKSSK